jgi:hypothetical protein
MSKRNEADDPTASYLTATGKKARLDLEEQIYVPALLLHSCAMVSRLASIPRPLLPTRSPLRNSCASLRVCRRRLSSKSSYNSHYLPCSNPGYSTSESVNNLIKAQVELEVQRMMGALGTRVNKLPASQRDQINKILEPSNASNREYVTERLQAIMEYVTSDNHAGIIKRVVKDVLIEEYKKGADTKLSAVLDTV